MPAVRKVILLEGQAYQRYKTISENVSKGVPPPTTCLNDEVVQEAEKTVEEPAEVRLATIPPEKLHPLPLAGVEGTVTPRDRDVQVVLPLIPEPKEEMEEDEEDNQDQEADPVEVIINGLGSKYRKEARRVLAKLGPLNLLDQTWICRPGTPIDKVGLKTLLTAVCVPFAQPPSPEIIRYLTNRGMTKFRNHRIGQKPLNPWRVLYEL